MFFDAPGHVAFRTFCTPWADWLSLVSAEIGGL